MSSFAPRSDAAKQDTSARPPSPPPPPSPPLADAHSQQRDQEPSTHPQTWTRTWTHMPRIPRATEACPHPLTLDQLIDWKFQWQARREFSRKTTQSERDDESECDRQFIKLDDEGDDFVMYDSEEERNERRRKPRQRPISPPRTPPHLKGPKLYTKGDMGPASRNENSKVGKVKSRSRVAPRRPYTRSRGHPAVSLHHRKGQVVYWRLPWTYAVLSFEEYLKDFDREELDKQPWEPMDFLPEHPDDPRKTPYQHEVCRRWTAQKKILARTGETDILGDYKGHT